MSLSNCLITSGYTLQCRNNAGGVKTVYVGNYTNMTYTLGTSSNVGQITAFAGTTASFYSFYQPPETADFEQAGAFSTENGTSFYTPTITFTLQELSATAQVLANTLGQGVWHSIILDQNGNYWYVGDQNGLRVTSNGAGAGKAMGDLNGMIIAMDGREPLLAYQCTTAAAASLIVP